MINWLLYPISHWYATSTVRLCIVRQAVYLFEDLIQSTGLWRSLCTVEEHRGSRLALRRARHGRQSHGTPAHADSAPSTRTVT